MMQKHINDNYKNAKISDSAAESLYASMEDGKVTINKLNPETLNKNFLDSNYIGPKNPKKYNGESDYSIEPTEIEVPAFIHDQDYDRIGAVGAKGLLFNRKTINADEKFLKSMDILIEKYKQEGNKSMEKNATYIRNGLGTLSSPKRDLLHLQKGIETIRQGINVPIFPGFHYNIPF